MGNVYAIIMANIQVKEVIHYDRNDRNRVKQLYSINDYPGDLQISNVHESWYMRNFKIDLETACKGNDITVEEYWTAKELINKV